MHGERSLLRRIEIDDRGLHADRAAKNAFGEAEEVLDESRQLRLANQIDWHPFDGLSVSPAIAVNVPHS